MQVDRNSCSGLDRKTPAGLERNICSGPIGITSSGNAPRESSSSSAAGSRAAVVSTNQARVEPDDERRNRTAQGIWEWVAGRGLRRLRHDRRVGLPEKERLDEWAGILLAQGIDTSSSGATVLERAVAAANRAGPWRSWKFLTLQIQIAAEQFGSSITSVIRPTAHPAVVAGDEIRSDWTIIKARIRERIPEIAFLNWFASTREVERCGAALVVAVPDEATAAYIVSEYERVVHSAALDEGITEVRLVTQAAANVANAHTDHGCFDQGDGHRRRAGNEYLIEQRGVES